jgi:hypothetical protein
MDNLVEAKKFIQQAADSGNADVVKECLKIADWFLCQEIGERDDALGQGTRKSEPGPSTAPR